MIADHLSHKRSNMSMIMRLMSGEIFLRIEAGFSLDKTYRTILELK